MIEAYKDKQPLFYEEVLHSIKNNKITHAYLIETNQVVDKDDIILTFIKTLMCKYHYTDIDKCNNCNICHLIDNNTLSDFMIIEPDGSWIKKEQILEIKEKFKTTSFQNDSPRIYLIRSADKLNKQAANSLLKFLEEPDGNIIAILEVDNRYKVLETIRSRCQVYTLVNKMLERNLFESELSLSLVKVLEQQKVHAISYFPITLENDYQTKNFWDHVFSDMIQLYENSIRKSQNLDYYDYGEILDFIISYNSLSNMIYKIEVLFRNIGRLDYNLNIPMMLDQFIIEFSGGEKNV